MSKPKVKNQNQKSKVNIPNWDSLKCQAVSERKGREEPQRAQRNISSQQSTFQIETT